MTAPGPEFDPHRLAVRARGHRVTPYRIGYVVGLNGEDLPNSYTPGSVGASNYREGVKYGRMQRQRERTANLPRTVP